MKKQPDPVDLHVGARVKLRRVFVGLSQEKLGDALGITFQQVQKYEKGTNRIGASRLQQASTILGVPVNFFFEGAPRGGEMAIGFNEPGEAPYMVDFANTPEGAQLIKAFLRIKEPKLRKKIIDLVAAMAATAES
ncbi:MAG: helix-turn-helix domain-containing protein [Beijerinckiaceae bacterium]